MLDLVLGFADEDYTKQGATIVATATEAWAAEMVVKVKEPLAEEYGFLREDLLLFTYLHMAAAPELADAMVAAKTTGVAYETVRDLDGQLPLLVPMSEWLDGWPCKSVLTSWPNKKVDQESS